MLKGKWISNTSNFEYQIDGPSNGDEYLIERKVKGTLEAEHDTIEIFITGNGTNHALIPESKFFGRADIRKISNNEIFINEEHLTKVAWEN